MLKTAQQIITNIREVSLKHQAELNNLTDSAEKSLLSAVLATEKKIAARLQGLLPEFQQGKVGDDKSFRILNRAENMNVAARIYSVMQNELQPFSDEGTQ